MSFFARCWRVMECLRGEGPLLPCGGAAGHWRWSLYRLPVCLLSAFETELRRQYHLEFVQLALRFVAVVEPLCNGRVIDWGCSLARQWV